MYPINSISLWNRTKSRAESLAADLEQMRNQFKNPAIQIRCVNSVNECVRDADIIVTGTFTSAPLLFRSMIKDNVHINGEKTLCLENYIFCFKFKQFLAVGAGENHHSELSDDIYKDSQTKIYVDNLGSARTELKTLNAPIVGEVGDIINGAKLPPQSGITIFHSMGTWMLPLNI